VAASAIHELIAGEAYISGDSKDLITADKMQLAYYEECQRIARTELPVEQRFQDITAEIISTASSEDTVVEAKRCMSCGQCFDCATCWGFCQDNVIKKPLVRGEPYELKLEF
jgi:Pyruvate/2-oxoacid:ferredoxin oxidoreductase delta subunit